MESYIRERVFSLANFILETNGTIRQTAKHFCLSKSTAHIDLSKRLKGFDRGLYKKVKKLLETNFEEKHLRGGQSTKNKYKKIAKNAHF